MLLQACSGLDWNNDSFQLETGFLCTSRDVKALIPVQFLSCCKGASCTLLLSHNCSWALAVGLGQKPYKEQHTGELVLVVATTEQVRGQMFVLLESRLPQLAPQLYHFLLWEGGDGREPEL